MILPTIISKTKIFFNHSVQHSTGNPSLHSKTRKVRDIQVDKKERKPSLYVRDMTVSQRIHKNKNIPELLSNVNKKANYKIKTQIRNHFLYVSYKQVELKILNLAPLTIAQKNPKNILKYIFTKIYINR